MTFRSDIETAQEAVGGFNKADIKPININVSKSDVKAMKGAATIGNSILQGASSLEDKVIEIAQAIPEYAQKIEEDDLQDAKSIKEAGESLALDPIF